MCELYFLIGLPCSGKTTWLKNQKIDNINSIISSTDNFIEEMANNDNIEYEEAFLKYYQIAKQVMDSNLEIAIQQNKTIYWDQTNIDPTIRISKIRRIPNNYYKVAIVFNTITEEEFIKRNTLRNRKMDIEVFRMINDKYNPPSLEEGFDFIKYV
jgi:tRNA uridine 5-carbamoylmethylation protein Kti12